MGVVLVPCACHDNVMHGALLPANASLRLVFAEVSCLLRHVMHIRMDMMHE